MKVVDVVRKLIGPIEPVGESNEDDRRLNNLNELVTLVDMLIGDISMVARSKDRQEHSMKRAGRFAHSFLKDIEGAIADE